MIQHTKSLSTVVAIIAATTMLSAFAPSATAAGRSTGAVASARSFRVETPKKNLFQEAVSTTVDSNIKWNLADSSASSMNVPTMPSPAEKATAARAEQERVAAQEAAAAQQSAAASRSQERAPLTNSGGSNSSGANAANSNAASQVPYAGGSDVLDIARQYIGTKYVWGGTTPSGFDCSGFVQYVFAQKGIQIPRVDGDQRAWFQANGTKVGQSQAQAGDFVWTSGHVGIYVGGGIMLDAPRPGETVGYHSMAWAQFEFYHLG